MHPRITLQLEEALQQGFGGELELLQLTAPKSFFRKFSRVVVRELSLERLVKLRSLWLSGGDHSADVRGLLRILSKPICPALENLDLDQVFPAAEHMYALLNMLSARLMAGCAPLKRLDLCVVFGYECSGSRVPWLRQLLASPALDHLEGLSFGCVEDLENDCIYPGCILCDDVEDIGDWMLRAGPGRLKSFGVSGKLIGPLPDSFLAALKGGALRGVRGLPQIFDGTQHKLVGPALLEGGPYPLVTHLRSYALGTNALLLEALSTGVFPAVEDMSMYLDSAEELDRASDIIASGKMPCLKRFELSPSHKCRDGVGRLVEVGAASGALSGLEQLRLQFTDARSMRALFVAMEGGRLPALRTLVLEAIYQGGEVGALIAGLGSGAFAQLEELEIADLPMRASGIMDREDMLAVVEALRRCRLGALRVLKIVHDDCALDTAFALFGALERARFPRLHTLDVPVSDYDIGGYGEDGEGQACEEDDHEEQSCASQDESSGSERPDAIARQKRIEEKIEQIRCDHGLTWLRCLEM
jgi:hypothetical protein